ncbi:hypothetical protein M3196_15170 [Fictibacillus nanhaiensis]|uniref:hypothetical protein n=1 Tax=Fictibacillus nanhaiensis TaxID=742169 RepID=UPI002040A134|nr:hypothetical protein [Fictibacillus nanhaiensis]MCM3732994.1 hypothetical protein [Fictibacillus nanhaiensis]
MKKLLSIFFTLCLLTHFGIQRAEAAESNFKVAKYEVHVLRIANTLRYDFLITNKKPLKSEKIPNFRGYHYQMPPIEIAVIAGKKLSSVMVMEKFHNSQELKMLPAGGSTGGNLRIEKSVVFSVEYQIKKGADFKKVREYASDGSVLIFDGMKEVAEFPLNK